MEVGKKRSRKPTVYGLRENFDDTKLMLKSQKNQMHHFTHDWMNDWLNRVYFGDLNSILTVIVIFILTAKLLDKEHSPAQQS